ncbi:MAG: hypothetical protein LR005_00435 [Candidatus Pacebacteria bacterium]|nr:hypothetical protein [Candidatus Paceibacterota bacterium]
MKNLFSKTIILIFVFLFSSLLGQIAEAQTFSLYTADDIFVETFPKIPGPNTNVELNLKSYSFNLNNYYIAWFLNGEKQSASYGNRKFKFKTNNSGTATNVTAVIEIGNQVFRKELRFVPSEVDLLWEVVDAYTPPFYRGKALPMQQAKIKITAIPETQLIAPSDAKNLVYYWDRNYKRNVARSGFGKHSFEFSSDALMFSEKISLTTNDRRENSFAKNTIDIPTKETEAKILFYEINEKGRIMTNKALNVFNTIEGDTVKLSFHPLNLSTDKPNFIDLFVNWEINDVFRAPQDFSKQDELYISSGGETGTVSLGVKLENIKKILQKVEANIDLNFEVN